MDMRESLDHVLRQKEMVADQFYALFLDRYPEVRPHFQGVDLRRQALLLTSALMMIERHFVASYPAAEMYLKCLGSQHHRRGIAPESYPKFREALLETLKRCHGQEWDPTLATQWGEAINRATATMLEGHREHFHV